MKQELIEKLLSLALEDTNPITNVDVPFEIGGSYFIRTVTYFATGRVKRIIGKFIESASLLNRQVY